MTLVFGGDSPRVGAYCAPAVIRCDTMTFKERLVGSVAVAGWLAVGASYVWPTVSPEYSELNKERIFLVWIASGIAILLWVIAEKRDRRMTFFEFVLWGGGLGMVAGAIAWGVYALGEKSSVAGDEKTAIASPTNPPPDNSKNPVKEEDFTALMIPKGAVLPITMLPLPPDPSKKPADPNDLEFYFAPLSAAAYGNWVQYAGVTVTNRSPRKMHLEIWGKVDAAAKRHGDFAFVGRVSEIRR